jgi:transcription elongation factor Elf1
MKLKRCPFCNSHELSIDVTRVTFAIKCFNCGAIGPATSGEREQAEQYWNEGCNASALVFDRKSNHHDKKEIDL